MSGARRRRRARSGRHWTLAALGLLAAVIVIVAIVGRLTGGAAISPSQARHEGSVGCREATSAFAHHESGSWLTMAGIVSRLLPDSHGRSTHERFILRCPSGQTVLIDNNVDVGRRAPVSLGERVVVRGQYIWNDLGGLIHDTHHSTDGNPDGWILVGNSVYS